MNLPLLLQTILAFFAHAPLFARELALTFDDAPNLSTALAGTERTRRVIEHLRASHAPPVAFFVNTARLDQDRGRERLLAYAKAGHLIANHTHSHPELNTTELDVYLDDIARADRELRGHLGFTPWFRYPFLREGETAAKRDGVRNLLDELGYKNAYVTINNYDWYMDRLFQNVLNRQAGAAEIKHFGVKYVQMLIDSAEYYDDMARRVLGRSPRHVLLLHENDAAAYFLSDLIAALRARGWTLIPPARAFEDPIASYRTADALPRNPGRIGELARDQGWLGDLWHPGCNEQLLDRLFAAE